MLGFVSVEDVDENSLCGQSRNTISTVQEIQGSQPFLDRLRSVGIVTGSRVRVLRTGCPVVIHSEGGRFCLRKEDASRIRVEPVSDEAAA